MRWPARTALLVTLCALISASVFAHAPEDARTVVVDVSSSTHTRLLVRIHLAAQSKNLWLKLGWDRDHNGALDQSEQRLGAAAVAQLFSADVTLSLGFTAVGWPTLCEQEAEFAASSVFIDTGAIEVVVLHTCAAENDGETLHVGAVLPTRVQYWPVVPAQVCDAAADRLALGQTCVWTRASRSDAAVAQ